MKNLDQQRIRAVFCLLLRVSSDYIQPITDRMIRTRFLSLVRSKLGLCWANHRAGYFINFPCNCHNELDSVSNHQPHECLLNRLFGRRSKKTSKLCVTGLYAGNSTGTDEFPAQRASNAENVSIWWRHHVLCYQLDLKELMSV